MPAANSVDEGTKMPAAARRGQGLPRRGRGDRRTSPRRTFRRLTPRRIYGPDRIPRGESLRRGEPIDAPAEGYLNLIHVEDAAQVVLDVEQAAASGRITPPQV